MSGRDIIFIGKAQGIDKCHAREDPMRNEELDMFHILMASATLYSWSPILERRKP